MFIVISSILLALFLILYVYCYFSFNVLKGNLKHYNFIINHCISTLGDGFYLWDEKNRVEKFSPNLQMVLDNVFYSFEEFANFFEQYEILKQNFIEARKSDKAFVIDLVAKECEVYCCCYGRSILDEEGNIIGVLIWIYNVTSYRLQINDLNRKNAKLNDELTDYIDILNTIPMPVWKRDNDFKVKKCNSFYLQFIKDNSSMKNIFHTANIKKKNILTDRFSVQSTHNLIISNERKFYNFTELCSDSKEEFIGYGHDITEIKMLNAELAYCRYIKRELINNVSNAIAVYDNEGKLQFYNSFFCKLWKLSKVWLNSKPTYYDFLFRLYKVNRLLSKKNFNYLSNKQKEFCEKLSNPYYDFFTLKNGITIKFLVIPDYLGELIFIYECVPHDTEKNNFK